MQAYSLLRTAYPQESDTGNSCYLMVCRDHYVPPGSDFV